MADSVSVELHGLSELKVALASLTDKMRKKALLTALRKAARTVLVVARREVPVMSSAEAAKNPYRTAGLLKKRLTVRTSRESRKNGNVGVFINVKPAAGAVYRKVNERFLGVKLTSSRLVRSSQRGAKSPNDPYYWRFVEFGTRKMAARPFLQPAAAALPEAAFVFEREVAAFLAKENARK